MTAILDLEEAVHMFEFESPLKLKDLDEHLVKKVDVDCTFAKMSVMIDFSFRAPDKHHAMTFVMPQISLTAAMTEAPSTSATSDDRGPETFPRCTFRRAVPAPVVLPPRVQRNEKYTPRERCPYFDMLLDDFKALLKRTTSPQDLEVMHARLATQCRRFSGRKSWAKTGQDEKMYQMHQRNFELCQQRRDMVRRRLHKLTHPRK